MGLYRDISNISFDCNDEALHSANVLVLCLKAYGCTSRIPRLRKNEVHNPLNTIDAHRTSCSRICMDNRNPSIIAMVASLLDETFLTQSARAGRMRAQTALAGGLWENQFSFLCFTFYYLLGPLENKAFWFCRQRQREKKKRPHHTSIRLLWKQPPFFFCKKMQPYRSRFLVC